MKNIEYKIFIETLVSCTNQDWVYEGALEYAKEKMLRYKKLIYNEKKNKETTGS